MQLRLPIPSQSRHAPVKFDRKFQTRTIYMAATTADFPDTHRFGCQRCWLDFQTGSIFLACVASEKEVRVWIQNGVILWGKRSYPNRG